MAIDSMSHGQRSSSRPVSACSWLAAGWWHQTCPLFSPVIERQDTGRHEAGNRPHLVGIRIFLKLSVFSYTLRLCASLVLGTANASTGPEGFHCAPGGLWIR